MKNIEKVKEKIFHTIGITSVITEYKIRHVGCLKHPYIFWDTAVLYPNGEIVQNDESYDVPRSPMYDCDNSLATKQSIAQYKCLLKDPEIKNDDVWQTEKYLEIVYVERTKDGIDLINYTCKVFYNEDKQMFDCDF